MALLKFQKSKGEQNYVLSVVRRGLAKGSADVHAYGCRQATFSNEKKAEKQGCPIHEIVEPVYYLGYYDLITDSCEKLSGASYEVYVEHVPENNEEAHCHVVLAEAPTINKDHKSAERLAIYIKLWDSCVGPARHICPENENMRTILESIDLPKKGVAA